MLTKRKKVFLAGAGSALLHVVLGLGLAALVSMQPAAPVPAAPEPIHVEIVDSVPVPAAEQSPTPEHKVVDTSDLKEVATPVKDAPFEGDRNTAAASEQPGTGDKPLPTQQGRAAPSYAFNPAPPVERAAATPSDQPPTEPAPPPPTRLATAEPAKRPAPTFVRNDLSMIDAAPASADSTADVNPYDPSFRSTAPPPPVPVRRDQPSSAYHPLEERTASSGSITTHGASSVAAVATPFGRYQKAMLDSIRAVWTQEIEARSDMASLGTIKVHFAVDRTGHVHAPRVLSNSSNEALASITLDAISTAAIPPIPPDVVESMSSALLQLDVTFECL
jgi:hypothetical protein